WPRPAKAAARAQFVSVGLPRITTEGSSSTGRARVARSRRSTVTPIEGSTGSAECARSATEPSLALWPGRAVLAAGRDSGVGLRVERGPLPLLPALRRSAGRRHPAGLEALAEGGERLLVAAGG